MQDALIVTAPWACLLQAQRRDGPRSPVLLGHAEVGGFAQAHLRALAGRPEALTVTSEALHWRLAAPGVTAASLRRYGGKGARAEINLVLREAGLIVAGRDEACPVLPAGARAGDPPLARIVGT